MQFTSKRPGNAGFALPVALAGLTILLIISSAGYLVSWLELSSARSSTAGTRAYHAAEAGLAMALAVPGRPPGPTRSVTLSSGSADLAFRPLLELAGRGALYEVRSTGSIVQRGRTFRRTVRRTLWVGDPPAMDAALSLGGAGPVTSGAGPTGSISGFPPPGCSGRQGAGIGATGPVGAGGVMVTGSPPVWAPATSPTTRTGLRWADLTSRATPDPVATVPPDAWPPPGPGWPVVRMTGPGPLGPAHSGRGVIVARDDLDIGGGFTWSGLILVGGSLRLRGDVTLVGAAFAGLDTTRVSTVDLGDGRLSLTFDPCSSDAAAAGIAPFPVALPGTWGEEW